MKVRAASHLGLLARACEDFRAARFAAAAEAIDGAERDRARLAVDLLLLRARIALKDDPSAALTYLTEHRSAIRQPRDRAIATMMKGIAYARLGDAPSAQAAFRDARSTVGADDVLQAELGYEEAAALWIARKLDAADRRLSENEPRLSGDLLVRARVLRGAIASAGGNLKAKGAILLETLPLARREATILTRAVIACQLASLGCELPSPALRNAAIAEVDDVPWTSDLADYHFDALRELAWSCALNGDHFNAFRRLKEAAAAAPTRAWKTMSLCDRAYLADAFGERRWAEQELRDATELAELVDWDGTHGEERFALWLLAELYAVRDPAAALAYVARYRRTARGIARTLSSHSDRRVSAMEAYSEGIVRRALGETAEAARLVRKAWQIYDAIGYDWRAGRAALALAEMTGEEVWRSRASDKLRHYAHSWLVVGNRAPTTTTPDLARLTGAQRTVVDLLVQGKTTADIARVLGRSEFTIRNHIKAAFKALGVNTRTALVARVAGTAR